MDYKLISLILVICTIGCQPQEKDTIKQMVKINEATIMQHLEALSSDAFEGRMPCARQDQKTVDYLQDYFKSLGLKAGNGNAYTQDVDLLDIVGYPSEKMKIAGPSGEYQLTKSDDYVIHSYRKTCLLYTSPSPRDQRGSRMPSSA